MPSLDDVAEFALRLPGAVETVNRGRRFWRTSAAGFVWERPYTAADLRREGPPPPGVLVALRVQDRDEKTALLAAEPAWLTSISHFDREPILLCRLDEVPLDRLAELVEDGWLAVGGQRRSG